MKSPPGIFLAIRLYLGMSEMLVVLQKKKKQPKSSFILLAFIYRDIQRAIKNR